MAREDNDRGPIEGEIMQDEHGGLPVNVEMDSSIIGGLTRAEIDMQVSTAHKYRRSVTTVIRTIESLATMDVETAQGCFYRLPRKVDGQTKFIEGPSIRFAEIVFTSYGNCRVASRRTDLTRTDIEATGIFHDLENNAAIARGVRRGITTSAGKRYSNDMINVTSNAAAAIAMRNAILAGVPRAIWGRAYEKAKETAKGNAATLVDRRAAMVKAFEGQEIKAEVVYELLGVRGPADITIDILFDAGGMLNAIRDGDATVESLLADVRAARAGPQAAESKSLRAAHGEDAPPAAQKERLGREGHQGRPQPAEGLKKAVAEPEAQKTEEDHDADGVVIETKVEVTDDFPGDRAPKSKAEAFFLAYKHWLGTETTYEGAIDRMATYVVQPLWDAGPIDLLDQARAATYDHLIAIDPTVNGNEWADPLLMEAWIGTKPPVTEVKAAARKMVNATSYRRLDSAGKDRIARIVSTYQDAVE